MKAWIHTTNGIIEGAILDGIDRDYLATMLGEWVLEGCTPVLHDFGDEPIVVGAPVPVVRQMALAV